MPGYEDDDDWTGTPPEGRHTRDQADPAYWRQNFPVARVFQAIFALLVVVVIVLALT